MQQVLGPSSLWLVFINRLICLLRRQFLPQFLAISGCYLSLWIRVLLGFAFNVVVLCVSCCKSFVLLLLFLVSLFDVGCLILHQINFIGFFSLLFLLLLLLWLFLTYLVWFHVRWVWVAACGHGFMSALFPSAFSSVSVSSFIFLSASCFLMTLPVVCIQTVIDT